MATQTFTIAASADDAFTVQASATNEYPPTGTVTHTSTDTLNAATRELNAGVYRLRVAYMRWDTTALPDTARPTSGKLRFWMLLDRTQSDGCTFAADYFTWAGTTADHTNSAAAGDAIIGYPLQNIGKNQYVEIPLSSVTGISLTGSTYMRFRIAGPTPTAGNFVHWPSYDHADSFIRPQLIVNYADPVTLLPDGIASQTNLTGTFSGITDDPDAPDATWHTAP